MFLIVRQMNIASIPMGILISIPNPEGGATVEGLFILSVEALVLRWHEIPRVPRSSYQNICLKSLSGE